MPRKPGRAVLYVVAGLLWGLFTIPLAAELAEERGHQHYTLLPSAVIFSLGAAALLRWTYSALRKRPFWSPWLFLLAALLAFVGLAGHVAGG